MNEKPHKVHVKNCPHVSILADEITSHGQEILSVCLHFLEVDKVKFETI